MQNLNDLIAELALVFDQIKADQIPLDKANALCNTAGKIVSVVNTQLQIIMVGGTETTQFMKGDTKQLRSLKPVAPTVTQLKKKLKKA